MKILFFIGSLRSGGKERRLVELLSYLKGCGSYEMLVVLSFQGVDYPRFAELGINNICLNKRANSKDFRVFFQLDKICKKFRPDIIHTWGSMQTFYMIPSALLRHISLINSQITDAPPKLQLNAFSRFVNKLNFRSPSAVLANSQAGLRAYGVERLKKSVVIYNGLNMLRFKNLKEVDIIKNNYGISTPYAVIMSASFSGMKDWDRFYKIAEYVAIKVNDISFVGVGAVTDNVLFQRISNLSKDNPHIILPGRTAEIENLVNACDVGVLFSTNGEGISNSILEYMALCKPVVVDECGGTPEFVREGENGFFTTNRTIGEIGDLIIELCHDKELRDKIGANGRATVENTFTLEKMGSEFEKLYKSVINAK